MHLPAAALAKAANENYKHPDQRVREYSEETTMTTQISAMLLTACICLTLTLIEAWCLTAVRHLGWRWAKAAFPAHANLLKSHIDFLLMSVLLFSTALTLDHLQLTLPTPALIAVCAGSILNPLGFLALAIKPTLPQSPTSPFGALMAGSFTLTTIGYLAIAGVVAWRVVG